MISNVGPADYNVDETLNTLRYASRAKHIQNKPRINEDPKDAMLREYQEEIQRLREQLAQIGSGADPSKVLGGNAAGPQIIEVEKVVQVKDNKKVKELEDKLQREKEEIKRHAEEEKQKIAE